jgi:hypothetical protein
MPKQLMLCVLLTTVLIAGFGSAVACTCIGIPTPAEQYEDSDMVFSGIVRAIFPTSDPYHIQVIVEVNMIWKGVSQEFFSVFTPPDPGMCGVSFEVGQEFLVYATTFSEEWGTGGFTHLCTRTRLLEWANVDLAYLGPPIVTADESLPWGDVKSLFR